MFLFCVLMWLLFFFHLIIGLPSFFLLHVINLNAQENITFMALFRNVRKMMKIARIDDYSLKDMSSPTRQRQVRIVALARL